jgi:hypothetical protein
MGTCNPSSLTYHAMPHGDSHVLMKFGKLGRDEQGYWVVIFLVTGLKLACSGSMLSSNTMPWQQCCREDCESHKLTYCNRERSDVS